MNTFTRRSAVLLAVSTLLLSGCTTAEVGQEESSSTAAAGSLAGSAGNVRRNLPRSNWHGDCTKSVERYIAASGHSAYASTNFQRFGEKGFVCAESVNQKSTAEAEARALAGCEVGVARWKYHFNGTCTIHASK